jgi:hypothetical protein
MTTASLVDVLTAHFDAQWQMFEDAIRAIPVEGWRAGGHDFFVPARLVFHAIQAVEFHLQHDYDPTKFDWTAEGVNWSESPGDEFPDRAAMLAYLDRVRDRVRVWLEETGEEGLLDPHPPYFDSKVSHAIYVLRHSQYHLGNLDTLLHNNGWQSPEWQ